MTSAYLLIDVKAQNEKIFKLSLEKILTIPPNVKNREASATYMETFPKGCGGK